MATYRICCAAQDRIDQTPYLPYTRFFEETPLVNRSPRQCYDLDTNKPLQLTVAASCKQHNRLTASVQLNRPGKVFAVTVTHPVPPSLPSIADVFALKLAPEFNVFCAQSVDVRQAQLSTVFGSCGLDPGANYTVFVAAEDSQQRRAEGLASVTVLGSSCMEQQSDGCENPELFAEKIQARFRVTEGPGLLVGTPLMRINSTTGVSIEQVRGSAFLFFSA